VRGSLELGRQRGVPPLKDVILPLLARIMWKRLHIERLNVKMLLIITSTGDRLFKIYQHRWPWTTLNRLHWVPKWQDRGYRASRELCSNYLSVYRRCGVETTQRLWPIWSKLILDLLWLCINQSFIVSKQSTERHTNYKQEAQMTLR